MKFKDNLKICGIIILFFIGVLLLISSYRVSKEGKGTLEDIYYYGVNDSDIKNEELLTFFVENSNSKLVSSLLMQIVGDYNEDVLYGVEYTPDKDVFNVYVAIDGAFTNMQTFDYLNIVEYDNYTYYFLSNTEELTDDDLFEYFNGGNWDIFELGREKK